MRLVPALAAALPLRRVLAFGSYARGDMHEGSDLDLLAVDDRATSPGERRAVERAVREIAWQQGVMIPIQVVVCTSAELESAGSRTVPANSISVRDAFLAHVLRESIEIPLTRPDCPGGASAPA